ncbi:restriction endonuclease subunit S [Micromonospora sp. NPDC023633]|uniref:restriction endonuclease subunit S n=1 Tax=Micromonospora sp. NPDC023633 TaxID=3154320 RepID=UPI003405ECB9
MPDSWGVVPLKHLATLSNGFAFKSDGWGGVGTPIIRIENLNGSENYNHSGLTLDDRYEVVAGDLLYSWSGNPGTSFGPFRWRAPGRYFLNQHIFKLSVHGCDKNWLYWALKAATHWIERELTSGMIGMVHVTKEELGAAPIPVPPPDKQRNIAEFLDRETARISRISELRAAEKGLVRDRADQLLADLYEQLSSRSGLVRLRHILRGIEQGWSPECEGRLAEVDEWGVIKAGCVNGGVFNPDEHKALPAGVPPRRQYRLRQGDLLMSRASGSPNLIGNVAIVDREPGRLLLCDKIYRLAVDDRRVVPEFLALMMRSPQLREMIRLGISGAGGLANNLPTSVVRDLPIPAIPLIEQIRFVREMAYHAEWANRAVKDIDQQLSLLVERQQALIAAAVTGQIDVTTGRGVV